MRGTLSTCVLVTAAFALCAADRFSWNWHKVERPTETLSQARLSEVERVALKAALSAELGPPDPKFSAEEQAVDFKIKLIDLNGDHMPEAIVQITGRFSCGATGNCPFQVFRKSGNTYESILVIEGINAFQGFTVTEQAYKRLRRSDFQPARVRFSTSTCRAQVSKWPISRCGLLRGHVE